MMISLLLSRVLGIVRDMVMAGMFGRTAATDAYRLAFQVPDLLFFLIAGGALSSAFIPVFSEYLHTNREKEAWHIFSVVTTVMSIIVIAFIVFASIFAVPLTHLIAPGKDPNLFPLIATMSRIVLPAQFAFFIGGLMFGTLYARQVFTVPGLGPNVYNIGIIFGAVFLSSSFTPGVIGMSWGALFGAVIGNLLIPYFVMRKLGADFKPSLDVKHPGVSKVFRLMLPVVLGLSLPGVYGLIMQMFGSYYPNGVNTSLDYGNRLMQAPLGIFGQSLAIGVFPALTQFYAQKDMGRYRETLATTMRVVIYLTVPISALMLAMPAQIVSAVYQHGAFTSADTEVVAQTLQWFAYGVCAWCLHPVLMRAFFAVQSTVMPIVIGTLTTALFVGLALALKTLPALGFNSLPLASSIAAIALVVALSTAVARRIGGLDVAGIGLTLGKSLIGGALVYAVALAMLRTKLEEEGHHHKLAMIAFVFGVSFVCTWVYYLATKAMRMPERDYLAKASKRSRKRDMPITPIEAGDD